VSWTLLFGLVFALGLALFAAITRRNDLRRMRSVVATRDQALRQGSGEAQLQHPVVDLSRCLGCGTCVAVCPEEGVLDLVHGQAMIINGTRCVGVAACERECPVDAITVTLSNIETRKDIPAITDDLEAIGAPGVFLAGEVTAHALIKTAIDHGVAVAAEIGRRTNRDRAHTEDVFDVCVIGAGPAGLACLLEAKRQGLRSVCIEQEASLGGTVAKYPRRKLVLTQPVDLPLVGRLKRTSYTKEQLVELWRRIAVDQELPIRTDESFTDLEWDERGFFVVTTANGALRTRHVCLALGRRGMPRKLDVPGEELPKVAYSLIDANSYQGRRILVVGGGDSAAETAVALAEQPGNEVTISYRKESFFRLKAKNQSRLDDCIASGDVRAVLGSEVTTIDEHSVELSVAVTGATGSKSHGGLATKTGTHTTTETLPNDEVFVMVGGTPMLALLERCGVSFDHSLRNDPAPPEEQGTGLVRALAWGFGFAVLTLIYTLWHLDYYGLADSARTTHPKHSILRPGLGMGLWFGITAAVLILVNLAYLLRRSPRVPLRWGSLATWMTSHVGTGVLALLTALVHSAMAPGDSPGGHALWALAVLMVTGAIGRYFYAYVPRAANGRELDLAEVRERFAQLRADWDHGDGEFADHARAKVEALSDSRQWKGSFFGRVLALVGVQTDLRRTLKALTSRARDEGIPEERVEETIRLTRLAHHAALMVAHFEDLRSMLNTWRYIHRWVAALLVLLVVVHIVHAMTYGAFMQGGPR
jgi:dihydropyrimidine dehydrogenase (NAD+) subunit PreT